MDANFWLRKWEKNEIAFHKSEANPILVKHFKALSLAEGSRIFLHGPLVSYHQQRFPVADLL